MRTPLCSRCKKNIAVVFITKVENGTATNEGLCLKCARELGIKQVDELVERMGISDEDLEGIAEDMSSILSNPPAAPDADGDEDDIGSRTATFPHMNRLFGSGNEPAPREDAPAQMPPKESGERPKKQKHKFLDTYCQNLTAKAREGGLDRIIGREVETERVIQILNRRQKNNPCLIGEPGVGKTAVAEGLAQKIAAGEVPYKLRDKEVYLLDMTSLVAGTQFRGQFESRMKSLIGEIKACGNVILVIDEVHNLVGAGDAEGAMNAANILKPALSRGEIQVIGATTFAEYRKYIEKDAALERRFQPVTVAEPTIDEAVAILRGVAHYYELYHGVSVSPEMARQTVLLSERYITDRYLPDKAIDLLDEACSDLNLHTQAISDLAEKRKEREDYRLEVKMLSEDTEHENYERLATLRSNICRLDGEISELEAQPAPALTMDNLARIIELWTKIPASKIRAQEYEQLRSLDERLRRHIVGQDEAIAAVCAAIRRKPYCVVLFDELEKAHPDVLNILLQILDDGRITDAQGRVVNFENTVIVMTSNAGSDRKDGSVGFGRSISDQSKAKAMKALSDFLRPEFINRIDEIVCFNKLTEENFRAIADIMLGELKENLAQRGITLHWDASVADYLVKKSYSVTYGARNLRRTLQKDIEDKVAAAIIDSFEAPISQIGLTAENDMIVLRTL